MRSSKTENLFAFGLVQNAIFDAGISDLKTSATSRQRSSAFEFA